MRRRPAFFLLVLLSFAVLQTAAQKSSSTARVAVPRLIRFSRTAQDSIGKPLSGTAGITFSLYKVQQGGAPLWMETQNAKLDRTGHYTVMLGGSKPDGLATDMFTSGEARWLGVQVEGQQEQPRVLLVAVPYALKAADAETVGGKPASAFMLAPDEHKASIGASASSSVSPAYAISTGTPSAAATITVGNIPKFSSTGGTLANSVMFQSSTNSIGVRGPLNLPAAGTASSAGGISVQKRHRRSQPDLSLASRADGQQHEFGFG